MSSTSPNGGAEWVHPNSLRVLPHRSPAKPSKQFQKGLDMVFSGAGPAAAAVLTNPFDVAKVGCAPYSFDGLCFKFVLSRHSVQ